MTDTITPTAAVKQTADQMAVTMARLLAASRSVFHGLASPLPAVAIALAKAMHNPLLEYLNIAGGVNITSGSIDVSTCSPRFLAGSESFFSLTDIFDLSARGELDTAFLGGVQVDRYGGINNSVIGDFHAPKVKLPGGAGSAAIVPTAHHTIVWRTRHDTRSVVEKCAFVTAAGNVREVVTPLGVLVIDAGELKIGRWYSFSSEEKIRANTGYGILTATGAGEEPASTEDELAMLARVDPAGVRYSEF
jgi:glutaconate CoA-transferase, subunit B